MAGMGPPPKPPGTRARRNVAPQTTKLPADGRGSKRAPRWPLDPDATLTIEKKLADLRIKELRAELANHEGTVVEFRKLERALLQAQRRRIELGERLRRQNTQERKLWADLWKTPQAVMWEKLAWDREVAQYVRFQIRAEGGDLDAAKEARQWSDRLGLNPLAMLRLRWEFERTEDAEARGRQRRERPAAGNGGAGKPKTGTQDPRDILRVVS
jgi:hypothetical protein